MKFFRRLRKAWYALQGKMPLNRHPEFHPVFYTTNLEIEGGKYNPEFFASEESTAELMRRFNALAMVQKPMMDQENYTPPLWHLRFEDGVEVCAGQMCKFYKDQPQDIAPMLCLQYIQLMRQEKRQG
jgi:hypothetical protein